MKLSLCAIAYFYSKYVAFSGVLRHLNVKRLTSVEGYLKSLLKMSFYVSILLAFFCRSEMQSESKVSQFIQCGEAVVPPLPGKLADACYTRPKWTVHHKLIHALEWHPLLWL